MTNSISSPRPTAVKPIHLWRSIDRAPLGYFPGIFSTIGNGTRLSFLVPAFPDIDPFDALDAKLYPTEEACMAAWEQSGIAEIRKGTSIAIGLSPEMILQINAEGLYRDPLIVVTEDNLWDIEDNPEITIIAEDGDE